jgi:anthranilate/para-aminobenzoate synthase component I
VIDRATVRLETSDPRQVRWACASGDARRVVWCDAATRITTLIIDGRAARTWLDPLEALDALPGLASGADGPTGAGRWVGFISYDLGRLFEDLPDRPADDLNLPLFAFALAQQGAGIPPIPATAACDPIRPVTVESSFSRADYERAVARVIGYIAAGDCYQVNLAQRLTVKSAYRPAEIYARLQASRPAVYAAFLDFGEFQIISNSPELFLEFDPASRQVTNRPIKGTRPNRPGQFAELMHSAKDQAELAMIVDLQRNDLGRVCQTGSVRVVEPRVIEPHPTVLHGVATIRGRLRDDIRFSGLLAATFPCGSITGCPKIRAMQIIDDLEPVARGPYCGAIGWLDHAGAMQFNVAIRTIIIKTGQVHFSVGGGIVSDSTPAAEYEETIVKARAMLEAVGGEL